MNTITTVDGLVPMVDGLAGWTLVLLVGGLGGVLGAAVVLRAQSRHHRPDEPVFDEVDDPRIDAMASAWANQSGRPWAAGIVADKLRLLARIERSRTQRQRIRQHHEWRRSERAARRLERRRRRDVRREQRRGWW